jgi:hypothetical protein
MIKYFCQGRHNIQHNDTQHNDTQHNNKNVTLSITALGTQYCYAECHLSSVFFMLSVTNKLIMPSVVILSVTNKPIKLSVVMLSVIMLSVTNKAIMLSVVMLSAVMLIVIMLIVTNKAIRLSVVMLSVIMLSVTNKPIMLSVVMLSVVAPYQDDVDFLVVSVINLFYSSFLANKLEHFPVASLFSLARSLP